MSFVEALLLGVVQGLTEFLPVSSTAHLVLSRWLFGVEETGLAFDVALHGGTFLAVVVYFRPAGTGTYSSVVLPPKDFQLGPGQSATAAMPYTRVLDSIVSLLSAIGFQVSPTPTTVVEPDFVKK